MLLRSRSHSKIGKRATWDKVKAQNVNCSRVQTPIFGISKFFTFVATLHGQWSSEMAPKDMNRILGVLADYPGRSQTIRATFGVAGLNESCATLPHGKLRKSQFSTIIGGFLTFESSGQLKRDFFINFKA